MFIGFGSTREELPKTHFAHVGLKGWLECMCDAYVVALQRNLGAAAHPRNQAIHNTITVLAVFLPSMLQYEILTAQGSASHQDFWQSFHLQQEM